MGDPPLLPLPLLGKKVEYIQHAQAERRDLTRSERLVMFLQDLIEPLGGAADLLHEEGGAVRDATSPVVDHEEPARVGLRHVAVESVERAEHIVLIV